MKKVKSHELNVTGQRSHVEGYRLNVTHKGHTQLSKVKGHWLNSQAESNVKSKAKGQRTNIKCQRLKVKGRMFMMMMIRTIIVLPVNYFYKPKIIWPDWSKRLQSGDGNEFTNATHPKQI